MSGEAFDVRVIRAFDEIFASGGDWDALLASSRANTVFLMAGWLRAWYDTLGKNADLIIPLVKSGGQLVAGAVFQAKNGIVEFAGKGPSDYSDIVLSNQLAPSIVGHVVHSIIQAARSAVPEFKLFRLGHIPLTTSITPSAVSSQAIGFFSTEERRIPAPSMEMSEVGNSLKKKSLRRHERTLARQGTLICQTEYEAERILPYLDEFFDQHIRRWQSTIWPSIFLHEAHRAFYRRATELLDSSGVLRFTMLRLDGRLIAAHYGFLHGGRFLWYKPTFEPSLWKMSPGEVLIKKLLELARDEHADEFDFTIGDEAFKYRFATKVPEVVDIHLTTSRFLALKQRMRVRLRMTGERLLGKERLSIVSCKLKTLIGIKLK